MSTDKQPRDGSDVRITVNLDAPWFSLMPDTDCPFYDTDWGACAVPGHEGCDWSNSDTGERAPDDCPLREGSVVVEGKD